MIGNDITNISLSGLILTSFFCILILMLPRKYAFIPLILGGCLLTLGQVLYIYGLHFTMIRVIIFFGWLRLFIKDGVQTIELNSVDNAIVLWVLVNTVAYCIQLGTVDALVNRMGFAYNALGMYFLFRFMLKDITDIERMIKVMAIIVVPLALLMLIEKITGHNIFSILGDVSDYGYQRDGTTRSHGPFAHPILAGTFGATLIPLLLTLWVKNKKTRMLSVLGVFAATIITITATSSGALLAYCLSIVGMVGWYFRSQLKLIRWSFLAGLLMLHVIMKAPIWHIFSRLSDLLGGTGDHRAMLIDASIMHFKDWFLVGTHYTAEWLPYTLEAYPDMVDITNQYIFEGITGGILTMAMFMVIIVRSFKALGFCLKVVNDRVIYITLWALGVSLLCHAVSFMSVAYTDQLVLFWYLLLASISTVFGITMKESSRGTGLQHARCK